jgi:hypothetical protein
LAALLCLATFAGALPGPERTRSVQAHVSARRVAGLGWWAEAERSDSRSAPSRKEALFALEDDDEDADPSRLLKTAQPSQAGAQTGAVVHPHEALMAHAVCARSASVLYLMHCLLLV